MTHADVNITYDVFAQRVGGVSRYFAQLVPLLPSYGLSARVWAGFHNNVYLRELSRSEVRGIRVPIASYRLATKIFPLANAATAPLWRPKGGILHPSYYTAEPRRESGPVVLTIYDMIHERYPDLYAKDDPTSRQKSQWAKRASRLIAISKSTKQDAVDLLGIEPCAIDVIYPGIKTPPAPPGGWPERSSDLVLFVGQRGGYKNWASVASALLMGALRQLRLVCFGGGAPRRHELEFLGSLGMTDRVTFESGDDSTLAELYRKAALLVYPSLYEGYGYPPLEAIAHGCPVVGGRTSSVAELLESVATLVDDPQDSSEMANAIEKTIGTTVAQDFDVPSCDEAARRHALLYRSLL